MLPEDVFRRFGFYVDTNFLDSTWCERIRGEVLEGEAAQATINRKGSFVEDVTVRRVNQRQIRTETQAHIVSCFDSLKPLLRDHFRADPRGSEDPICLVYEPGDFYKPHRDASSRPGDPLLMRSRSISTILFVNNESEQPQAGSYCGGSVVFYGVVQQPGWEKFGFPLQGHAGLLVAFPSDILHEVKPVTAGRRCTVVSWFHS